MKKLIFILIAAILITSCASNISERQAGILDSTVPVSTGENTQNFSDVEGKNWQLIEVHTENEIIQIDRYIQQDVYVITFSNGTVSGTGAPNRYSAPYNLGSGSEISIMPLISTLMAPIFEISNLSEHEYYTFLQNSYMWELVNNTLELYSRTDDNRDIKLVFSSSL